MKTKSFTLPPALRTALRITVNIPAGMEIVDSGQPRLTSAGDINVTTVAVHDGSPHLSARTMLERAASKSPFDNLRDLEEVRTRGLSVDCDYLLTNIRLCDSYGDGYVLYLFRSDERWIKNFCLSDSHFYDLYQVLCFGK